MENKKIVFVNIVGGDRHDVPRLMGILSKIQSGFTFIVAPPGKEIRGISIEQLKALIKEVEDDNPTTVNKIGEKPEPAPAEPASIEQTDGRSKEPA